MTLLIVVDGRQIPIVGRTAEMIRWLAVNEERINSLEQGSVTLHFSGASLKAELKEVNAITIRQS